MNRTERVLEFLDGLNVDIDFSAVEHCINDIIDFDSLLDELENNDCLQVEVIYYSNAMNYLRENDPSLSESIEIANELGFDLNSINSELLASLHATENLRSDFWDLETEINEFFEELEEEEEEEE